MKIPRVWLDMRRVRCPLLLLISVQWFLSWHVRTDMAMLTGVLLQLFVANHRPDVKGSIYLTLFTVWSLTVPFTLTAMLYRTMEWHKAVVLGGGDSRAARWRVAIALWHPPFRCLSRYGVCNNNGTWAKSSSRRVAFMKKAGTFSGAYACNDETSRAIM
jgi:hypothetical protein